MIPCHCPFKHSTLFFLSRFEKNSDEKPLNGREANQGCLEGSLPCNEAVQNNRGPKSGRKQQCLAKKASKIAKLSQSKMNFCVLWIYMTVAVFVYFYLRYQLVIKTATKCFHRGVFLQYIDRVISTNTLCFIIRDHNEITDHISHGAWSH